MQQGHQRMYLKIKKGKGMSKKSKRDRQFYNSERKRYILKFKMRIIFKFKNDRKIK